MNEKFFKILERIAIENPGTRGNAKMAAGIVYRKMMVATGVNSYKSHPLMLKYGRNDKAIFLHSEIDAIKNALRHMDPKDFRKCDMYIIRVHQIPVGHKDFMYVRSLAKPCQGCQEAIDEYGFANVYWSDSYAGLDHQICMAA